MVRVASSGISSRRRPGRIDAIQERLLVIGSVIILPGARTLELKDVRPQVAFELGQYLLGCLHGGGRAQHLLDYRQGAVGHRDFSHQASRVRSHLYFSHRLSPYITMSLRGADSHITIGQMAVTERMAVPVVIVITPASMSSKLPDV